MRDRSDTRPLKALLLAVPETTPATLFSLYEVFASVAVAWEQVTGEATRDRRVDVRIVSRDGRPFPSALGIPIAPQASLAETGRADWVIVTDLALDAGAPVAGRWAAERDWLRRQAGGGATVCSVCTGSVLLAAAGLLDGLEATTHWSAVDLFRRSFPRVRLRPERILCPAGPGHRILTGGGQGSWEDLALHLIARDVGVAEAIRIAKVFVLGDRSSGQLPFSAMGRPQRHDDAVVADSQVWLADNYMQGHPVRCAVERSGLAGRTFKRRFKAATGYSPVDYVQALRVEEAKHALETGDMPTEAIAREVGYEDPSYFRRLFKRRTGLTPSEYRRRFNGRSFLAAT